MSYRHLEHSTDAIIEVIAPNLKNAFEVAGMSVVETIIDSSKIDERDKRSITVTGKDLRYLLYNWLEEIIILTITDGFAIKKILVNSSKARKELKWKPKISFEDLVTDMVESDIRLVEKEI